MNKESILFTPGKIGPLTLRNRTVRASAFESMCPGNAPSKELYDYHRSVAAGGIGMTNLAYAAVTKSGLSFEKQLWMRTEIVPGLRKITDAIHAEGAAACIQLGHCGNMSHSHICGCTPISASSGFNIYSPTRVRGMNKSELAPMAWVDLGNMRAALEGILLIAKGSQGQAAVVDSYAEQKEKRIGGEHNESGERA